MRQRPGCATPPAKMKPAILLPLFLITMTSAYAAEPSSLKYPVTRQDKVSDVYHGVTVADPYRWLEDDNAAETKAWVKAQNEVTFDYLRKLPRRDKIKARLTKLWNYERVGLPFERGGRWFVMRNSGLQNQSVLHVAESLDGEQRVLIDPNTMSADGTISLTDSEPSEDGKLLAYGVSHGGSDWNEVRVRDVTTGKDLTDHLRWVKFSGASWAPDGSGVFYSRYDAPAPGSGSSPAFS